MSPPPDRPLALGELLAETVRIYGARLWAAIGLGTVHASALVASAFVHPALYYAVASLMVAVTFGAATRIVVGDSFREAWAQVAVRLPVLLVLAFVVGVPFVLASSYLLLVLAAALWIALSGFSIPVAMVEDRHQRRGLQAIAHPLERTIALARVEYLHAAGIAAALVLINVLVGVVLEGALVGFADNSRAVGALLSQVVLAPFFFLGLSVLYFEQRARAAVSSRPKTA